MVLRWESCAYRIMRCNDCARHSDPLVGLQVCWKACLLPAHATWLACCCSLPCTAHYCRYRVAVRLRSARPVRTRQCRAPGAVQILCPDSRLADLPFAWCPS